MSKFTVRLTNLFSEISGAKTRSRAGITVPVGGVGVTADLTPAQVAEIEADQYLTLHDPTSGKKVTSVPVVAATSKKVATSTPATPASATDAKE